MLTAGDLRTVLIPTPVKTSAYTAHHGDFVLVDTTAASVTVTLPLNPPQNSAVGLKQVATAGGHTVTVAAAGAASFNLQGGATTLTLTLLSQGVLLQYSSGVWVVQSDDLPLAQLDARYSLSNPVGYQAAYAKITSTVTQALTAATWTAVAGAPSITLPAGGLTYRVSFSISNIQTTGSGGMYIGIGTSTSAILATSGVTTTAATPYTGRCECQQVTGSGQAVSIYAFAATGTPTLSLVAGGATGAVCELAAYRVA